MSDRLKEIRERLEKATPGPWEPMGGFWFEYARVRVRGSHQDIALCEGSNHDANGVFIAHAREDIPFLLSELERVTAERDEARKFYGPAGLRAVSSYIEERDRLRSALDVAKLDIRKLTGFTDAERRIAEIERIEMGQDKNT